jgi:hypothetical protein
MMHRHLPIRWGHPVWIRFVHHRDAVLRGDMPAMQTEWNRVWAFENYSCPVCAKGTLFMDKKTYYCKNPRCFATYVEREECINTYPWRAINLYLQPGQTFHNGLFPPLSKLPQKYPIHT